MISARVLPQFPARVSGTNGVAVEKENGAFTVKSDWGALAEDLALPNIDDAFVGVWKQTGDLYTRVSLATLLPYVASGIVTFAICRADIATARIPLNSFAVSGFYAVGDLGSGAVYVRGTSTGPMAIKDLNGTWWNLFVKHEVRAGWCGVKCDGTTDDTAAFRLAHDLACAACKVLRLETGTMLIASATEPFTSVSELIMSGNGHGASVIKWEEGSLVLLFGRRWDVAGRISNVIYKDFAVLGTHGDDSDYTTGDHYPFLSYNVDGLLHDGVRVEKSRVMGMVARGSTNVRARDCTVRYCARDGINFADCDDYDISNNLVEFVDDDSIAAHNDTTGRIDRRGVIANNRIRFAQGIKALGMVTGAITGNVLEFVMGQGITCSTVASGGSVTEGRNAANGVSITGNVIKNCIDRSIVDALNTTTPAIYVTGNSAQAGGLAAIPGENNTGTGAVIDPYPYYSQSNDGGVNTDPVPASGGIVISGNVVIRDIPAGGSLSSLGFGTFYTRNGPVDPTLTLSALRQPGVVMDGLLRNVLVQGNAFQGIGYAVFFYDGAKVKALIQGNTAYDVSGGIGFSGGNTNHHSVFSRANVWDIDPFHSHSNRGANGTWTASGAPYGVLQQNAYGFTSAGDVFRNCCRVSDLATNAAIGTTDKIEFRDALLDCVPASIGFSTSNKGIGEIPRAGPSFWHRIVDCDPASATFGQVLNTCKRQANAQPSSGTYVVGAYVENSASALGTPGAGKFVSGWKRLTTGSGHVAGTDWAVHVGYTS